MGLQKQTLDRTQQKCLVYRVSLIGLGQHWLCAGKQTRFESTRGAVTTELGWEEVDKGCLGCEVALWWMGGLTDMRCVCVCSLLASEDPYTYILTSALMYA